ncbi:hypothetical protein BXO8_05245 [Xanthomonas oryzae pv. oryzae]|nr:hypothetical protein BXO8_05245 [Xanthomonas oryzae pv. oryzae]OLI53524.1 hypothetical protein IXO89_11210 [Xanthomonas oryzae pv. oryzae]OLK85686.1 hypothetical protein IXO1221_01405 [Xanthomonas oryzae pv. oryzae]OLK88887.1 hypothetical protein IXO884_19230 [Xanthomonas oryzae pv. oryzae]
MPLHDSGHARPLSYLRRLRSDAFQHQRATGAVRLQRGVGAAQVVGADAAVVLAQGGAQHAGIHQLGDAIEQMVLGDHVVGFE